MRHTALASLALALLTLAPRADALVTVALGDAARTKQPDGGERLVQSVTLANDLAGYTLTYDITSLPGKADEITSQWWVWTTGMTTLGMTQPSNSNFYFQGFFNWTFDDDSLHKRPATVKVLRDGGSDGAVEYTWDTPKVTARIRFVLVDGSDKLLMLGSYTPKQPIKRAALRLGSYASFFDQPRNRAVTTAVRTGKPGEVLTLDPARERWFLMEDTTPDRPGNGSAGVVIGTPDAFSSVSVPVGDYGIFPEFVLKPEARAFGLALYSYPPVPEYETTRAYFRATGDAEAAWAQTAAATDPATALPAHPLPATRTEQMQQRLAKLLNRDEDRWQPDPRQLALPWAARLPGGPIRTVLFCPRYTAYETMELARRVELSVKHLYWDSRTQLSDPDMFPYAGQTGVGTLGLGALATRAGALVADPETELFLLAGLQAKSLPSSVRRPLLDRVQQGAGLCLVGGGGILTDWPKALFTQPDPALADSVLAGFAWDSVPGYREGERDATPMVTAFRYGAGRVVVLRVRLAEYSSLVPRTKDREGLDSAADHALALAGRAVLAASGRPTSTMQLEPLPDGSLRWAAQPVLPAGATLRARLIDDLDRRLALTTVPATLGRPVPLPRVPGGRIAFADLVLQDSQGRTLGYACAKVATDNQPTFGAVSLDPVQTTEAGGMPLVLLPRGGHLRVTVPVQAAPAGARVEAVAYDVTGRIVARDEAPVAGGAARFELSVPPPVTVAHGLDLRLLAGTTELAATRQRFTLPLPYPHDDYTALLWTYIGGEPVVRRVNDLCYRQGADSQDLCNLLGQDDAGAAREYDLAARSGLRILPYATRIYGEAGADHQRRPGLFDPAYHEREGQGLTAVARQARPFSPAGFTLGDENYLSMGSADYDLTPSTVAAYRNWLRARYGTVGRLNATWGTTLADFEAAQPMLLSEAKNLTVSLAPWLDHKRFMDAAFADVHREFAGVIRANCPGAKVGFDGLLNYNWSSGYDFAQLTNGLDLNQVYVIQPLQTALVRSLKQPGAFTGTWGNGVADGEAGFGAWPWHGLLAGDSSVWWWTSWGCDYIPFGPDLSPNRYGQAFFAAVGEVTAGPGRLLRHATREDSGVSIWYNQADVFAATLIGQKINGQPYSGDSALLAEYQHLFEALSDLGYQPRFRAADRLADEPLSPERDKVLFLPLATCLGDWQVKALAEYVEAGGTLVVDGRAGLLTGNGSVRETRPLDSLLGVTSEAGSAALTRPSATTDARLPADLVLTEPTISAALMPISLPVLEPGLKVTDGEAGGNGANLPVLIQHQVGRGRTLLLNFALQGLAAERRTTDEPLLTPMLGKVLAGAGLRPYATVKTPAGDRPRCLRQVRFADGRLSYLGLEQDLLQRGMADQPAHVKLPAAANVYDVRTGKQVGNGPIAEWDVTLSRATPRVYALLPYPVTAVRATAPATASLGRPINVALRVEARTTAPGFHVVRLDVYPPAKVSTIPLLGDIPILGELFRSRGEGPLLGDRLPTHTGAPHRQYSQNVDCPAGAGSTTLVLALNDPPGPWRLAARDVATGVRSECTVQVK